jgi:hypothetical protein
MSSSFSLPNRAILSAEERAMLALQMESLSHQPFEQVSSATGLHPDVLRMLVRDGLLDGVMHSWKDQIGVCHLAQAHEIAEHLNTARAAVEGQPINAYEAEAKYRFPNATIYNWQRNGWIKIIGTGRYNAKLFNEGDIAFARALADLRGQAAGKSIFPAKPRSGRPRKK